MAPGAPCARPELVDLAFPFAYGLMFASLTTWLMRKDFPSGGRAHLLGGASALAPGRPDPTLEGPARDGCLRPFDLVLG